jgi:hypothetical protein
MIWGTMYTAESVLLNMQEVFYNIVFKHPVVPNISYNIYFRH